MPRTLAAFRSWAKSHPNPHQGGSWNGLCEQFVNNAGDFNYGFNTALLDFQAAKDAGELLAPADCPIQDVPDGFLLFWAYGSYGHVAVKDGSLAWMASSYVTRSYGAAVGTITAADYQNVSGHSYLGASAWHGPETLEDTMTLSSADKTWIKQQIEAGTPTPPSADEVAKAVWGYPVAESSQKGAGRHMMQTYGVWGWRAAVAAQAAAEQAAKNTTPSGS